MPRSNHRLRRRPAVVPDDQRRPLDRILQTPDLAHVVPALQPQVLHQVIQTCGLEDCAALVALATPRQLARVFDIDLWRPARPGAGEQFDADRFGVWLEVLMESGAAAEKLAGMDADLVATAFAQYVRVFDLAAKSPVTSSDGDEWPGAAMTGDGPSCEVGGYLIEGRRADSWDAVVAVLVQLDSDQPACFHRVMQVGRALSNSMPEVDGLDALLTRPDQAMFDLALSRERRRDQQGYVSPAQAAAFLQLSRQIRLDHGTMPAADPVARAYFGGVARTRPDGDSSLSHLPPASDAAATPQDAAVAAIVDVLLDAGALLPRPRALLGGAPPHGLPSLARILAQMQAAADRDHAACSLRTEELAFLSNALAAGCSVRGRPLTAPEASAAALATCNLGLENWPASWLPAAGTPPADFLVDHDLIGVFQVGWTVLHEQVCMHAIERVLGVLRRLWVNDRETQGGLDALRIELARHRRDGAPWRARGALGTLAILDGPAVAILQGLIAECPVLPDGIGRPPASRRHAISATAFEFISENRQIASVHEYLEELPAALHG